MGIFGNETLDSLFGDIFGTSIPEYQQEQLDIYWRDKKVQEYYHLVNTIKSSGAKIYRNDVTGKHIVKRCSK